MVQPEEFMGSHAKEEKSRGQKGDAAADKLAKRFGHWSALSLSQALEELRPLVSPLSLTIFRRASATGQPSLSLKRFGHWSAPSLFSHAPFILHSRTSLIFTW